MTELVAPAGSLTRLARWPVQSAAGRLFYRTLVGFYFHRHFRAHSANEAHLKQEVFRIRYDVYCDELGWEAIDQFPDAMERDEYDDHSLHCLLEHARTREFAGCVRVVLASPREPMKPFPFELACADVLSDEGRHIIDSNRTRAGEISRLAVRSYFRRRAGEAVLPAGAPPGRPNIGPDERRRRTPHIAMCLYLAAACQALNSGFSVAFALMEPRLVNRLAYYGIRFKPLGGTIEHRGVRAPYYISRELLFSHMSGSVRGLLEVVGKDLQRSQRVRSAIRENDPA